MRILLDNNVTQKIAPYILGHEVNHARELDWASLQNGSLIRSAESAGFDVLVTADRNMQYQQNIKGRKISIVLLSNYRITIRHLKPLIPELLTVLEGLPAGSFVTVTLAGSH